MARKTPVPLQDITIFDVAREANVSYSTVSRVINNKGVRADKRERVLRAMSELGYVANLQARSLAACHRSTEFFTALQSHLTEIFAVNIIPQFMATHRVDANQR